MAFVVSGGERFVGGVGAREGTSDGEGAVDVVPPASVDAGVADYYKESEGETELGYSGEVEGFGVCEDRHRDDNRRNRGKAEGVCCERCSPQINFSSEHSVLVSQKIVSTCELKYVLRSA